ncbi:MAG TPA: glycoside hydrolase family 32 protein [Anaerohalosphaeraceae bacterium]|nr:glycoside hydrolase family 32 protein [Anaerohalosphaeraceae bacterium]
MYNYPSANGTTPEAAAANASFRECAEGRTRNQTGTAMTKLMRQRLLWMVILVYPAVARVLAYESFRLEPRADILIADFEGSDYGDWQALGEAFGPGPARGTLPGQMEVTGYLGHGLVNTFYGGDGSTGTLTSPPFEIKHPYINFLIGGGGYAGQTCINLLVDGQVVRTATGPNTEPGGSEHLDWQFWDVREFLGQMAQIQIADLHTGGWGHINVDHIVQSYKKRETVFNKERAFTLSKKYLIFPVKNGASKRRINLFAEGEKVREFEIELAPAEADFWVYLDIREFSGRQATLQIDRYSSDWQTGFDAVNQADTFPGEETLYQEKRRPQIHFTARRGWMNDVNGLVFCGGQYHLFFQHNPYGWGWGNMTWGHAVSTDLVHWQEWGDALHPDALGTIYSGSAVADQDNTAGLQTGSEQIIAAFYTSAGGTNSWSAGKPFTQSMAFSRDSGHTWTKYAHNPVLGHIIGSNRDPKVFWHEGTGKWIMVLWMDGSTLSIFTSSDLKTWQKQSDIDGFFECPEMFELPVDGNPANTKWVVYGASGDYKIGQFDGRRFTADGELIKFEYGNCFYASQTFNNIPPSDGRRIQMAWGRVDMPGMPFNQMALFPVVLSLRPTAEGIRMVANPVEEIANLHQQPRSWSNLRVHPGENPLSVLTGELFHIKTVLRPQGARSFRFVIRTVPVSYHVSSQQLTCLGKTAPLAPENGTIRLEILADRMSIEIFANGGRIYMPMGVDMAEQPKTLEFVSEGGDTLIEMMNVYPLRSIWF